MNELTHTLPITLQQARKARRLSQLELSLRLGVSQRHVSFVESSRAKPSRDLLLAWLAQLDVPLSLCNAAMLQAGYAPAYGAAPLNDPSLKAAHEAVIHLLRSHDPLPAMVIDADWNLLHINQGAKWLATLLMPWSADLLHGGTPLNLLDVMLHQDGFCGLMSNLAEVGPALLAHLRTEAASRPQLTPKVEAFAALLRSRLGPASLHSKQVAATVPVLTTRYATQYGELAFFSMFSTFGTPQNITLASLRVEHLFPADDATRAVLLAHVGQGEPIRF